MKELYHIFFTSTTLIGLFICIILAKISFQSHFPHIFCTQSSNKIKADKRFRKGVVSNDKKNRKLSLDLVLLLVLVLMYQKQVLTLAFHEIGGLCLFAPFALHTILNRKWVAAVGARLFDRTLSIRLRLCYWIDVFLVASFICVAVSGVLISKIIGRLPLSPHTKGAVKGFL